MNETTCKKSRWFWPWEDEMEEAWLAKMAKSGFHLVHIGYLGRYTFSTGVPQEMVYRLDFVASGKKDESYFNLFQDAGWEHVGEMGGWQYWRKEVRAGESPEIFTDSESKIRKYMRILGFLVITFIPIAFSLRNMSSLPMDYRSFQEWTEWVFSGLEVFFGMVFFLYIYIFIRLFIRIRQLKRM